MLRIDPKETSVPKFHGYLISSVAPRPIAFASTVDKNGSPNLAPFSFFNAFSAHPPILIFSPARSVRENLVKNTVENVLEHPEVVINVVTYEMVHQTSLASAEYPRGVNEFQKAGFTPVPSEIVKPARVKESPVQMECKVLEVKQMGTEGGAANLIICEVVLMHINESVLDAEGKIDQHKIDLVGRLGKEHYIRSSGSSIFDVAKPKSKSVVGIDNIPERIRYSNILTGNDLGQLGCVDTLPTPEEVASVRKEERVIDIMERFRNDELSVESRLHELARELISEGNVTDAWKVLLLTVY